MAETSLQKIEKNVIKAFSVTTPAKYKKTKPGAGGHMDVYVETKYVISELNRLFGLFWEWKIVDKKIGEGELWVQGELTAKTPDGFCVTKTGFGGSKIKTSTTTKLPLSIGNDLKAASTLALKKAASLFGIAADVYYGEMDWFDEISEEEELAEPRQEDIDANLRSILMRKMFAIAANKGFSEDDIDKVIKKDYGIESKKDLNLNEVRTLIERLEAKPDAGEIIPVKDVAAYNNADQDCLYTGCDKGENGKAAKRVGTDLFCSKDCKDLYAAA